MTENVGSLKNIVNETTSEVDKFNLSSSTGADALQILDRALNQAVGH